MRIAAAAAAGFKGETETGNYYSVNIDSDGYICRIVRRNNYIKKKIVIVSRRCTGVAGTLQE